MSHGYPSMVLISTGYEQGQLLHTYPPRPFINNKLIMQPKCESVPEPRFPQIRNQQTQKSPEYQVA